jgi:hypothetical protein
LEFDSPQLIKSIGINRKYRVFFMVLPMVNFKSTSFSVS